MDLQEACGWVWEALAEAPAAMTPSGLASSTGLPDAKVLSALARLRDARLVEVVAPLPHPSYTATLKLDAMRWARALEAGVPLNALEQYAQLSAPLRQEALRLASSGKVDARIAGEKAKKKQESHAFLAGRAATRAAQTDAARIADDTQQALSELAATGAHDAGVEAILRQAHAEARRAVDQIVKSLS